MTDARSDYYKVKLTNILKKAHDNAPENEFFEEVNGFNSELDAEIKAIDANIQNLLKAAGVLR